MSDLNYLRSASSEFLLDWSQFIITTITIIWKNLHLRYLWSTGTGRASAWRASRRKRQMSTSKLKWKSTLQKFS